MCWAWDRESVNQCWKRDFAASSHCLLIILFQTVCPSASGKKENLSCLKLSSIICIAYLLWSILAHCKNANLITDGQLGQLEIICTSRCYYSDSCGLPDPQVLCKWLASSYWPEDVIHSTPMLLIECLKVAVTVISRTETQRPLPHATTLFWLPTLQFCKAFRLSATAWNTSRY